MAGKILNGESSVNERLTTWFGYWDDGRGNYRSVDTLKDFSFKRNWWEKGFKEAGLTALLVLSYPVMEVWDRISPRERRDRKQQDYERQWVSSKGVIESRDSEREQEKLGKEVYAFFDGLGVPREKISENIGMMGFLGMMGFPFGKR
ncbi:MAG: hypothetical protein KKG60_00560 [Nanoarchaeota archaeon]|nr:hypothetical protein [Nanoarchaeota archaeon]